MRSVAGVAAGAAALTACGVDQAVSLAMAALHVRPHFPLGFGPEGADLLRGLCSPRREKMLGGSPRGGQLLLAPLHGIGCHALGLSLRLCDDPPSLVLCLAYDVRGNGVEPRLVKDRGAEALALLERLLDQDVGLLTALLGGRLGLSKGPLGRLGVGFGSQTSALEGRLRLQARTLQQPARSLLAICQHTLMGLQLLLELARAALMEPLTDQLQVAVDLDRVIPAPNQAEVALQHEDRAHLTLTA